MTAPATRYERATGVAYENARCAATIASACGDVHVVLSPGSRSTPLALAFDACTSAKVHVVLDERAAGFVALGIGRATGRPAVLLCTSGSAGAHYLPAVIEARQSRVPLLALTADRPAELQACGAPQTVPQARLFGEYVRFHMELPVPDASLDMRWLRNALAQARARTLEPAGPVHINAPFREPLWAPGLPTQEPLPPAIVRHGTRTLSTDDVAALAGELMRERGVIVLGPRAPATMDARALGAAALRFGRALGWPVIADAASGVRFGEPEVISCAEAIVRHDAEALSPTLVLRIGMLPTSKVLTGWLGRHGRTILIDPDGEWHDPDGAADALIIADPAPLCEALAVESERDAGWLAAWRRAEARAARALASVCCEPDWEGAVARAVVEALPEGTQLHLGSSMPIRDVDAFAPSCRRRIDVHVNRGANGIDGTIATALGEALAKGPTVALLGDLTFVHDLDGLAALGELRAPLTIVVVHNGGGGIFRFLPIARHPTAFERLFATPQRADLAALCRAFDIPHRLIEPQLVGKALEALEGPSVLEVRIDPATNLTRHEQAWARAQRALERGKGA
ncbi:MAG TPA: 2-succinyl-5-enolpyruvyl-6-hydroxy-3-cyclohexene-1-carboxylic-acid synthase [Polyangiaceae bacterium]|nr:2-succinyl-5-enolpyruvyl-6-hydroxy-3-cyclohexene-1-carboxylic-acid synthase [Polyangiaceae bacterium]